MNDPSAYQPGDRLHGMPTPARVEGHPEGTRTQGWTGAPPLPYRDDTNPPPHWFWGDIYKRMKRRPRCDGEG